MEERACPHCGEVLPPVADAFCPSCREPLDPPPVDAPPAGPRRDLLLALLANRASQVTVGGLFRESARLYFLTAVLLGGSAGLLADLGADWLAAAILGILAGVLARDLASFRAVVEAWPTLAAVLDWGKIEQLAGAAGPDAAPGTSEETPD